MPLDVVPKGYHSVTPYLVVPGVKALLAHIHDDPAWAQVVPPLSAFAAADRVAVVSGYDQVRAKRVA